MSATTQTADAGRTADQSTDQVVDARGTRRRNLGEQIRRLEDVLCREALLIALLVMSFLTRWLIADRNSYWYDELLSVAVYGRWRDSALDAVNHLATYSIHPPLYQFVLYHWMDLFGDGERATRSLSNLYITLATLFIFLLVRTTFSRRVALASATVFALMYVPMYYGIESRSYAQTILLVTLSSYALVRMARLGEARGWRAVPLSPYAVLFMGANIGMLLTHYYNAFFWAAQGLIVGLFVLRELRPRHWFAGLTAVVVMYGLQGATFVFLWGDAFLTGVRRRGGDFAVESGVRNPLDLLESVVRPNLDPHPLFALASLVVAVGLLAHAVFAIIKRSGPPLERQQAWTIAYLFGWLLLPLLVVYVAFEVAGVARYSSRYWLFIVPALAPLIVLALREANQLIGRAVRHRWGVGVSSVWPATAVLAVIGALVLPGTLAAATAEKIDWRGTVRRVVDVVEADGENSYIVFETGWSSNPRSRYYFERFSPEVAPSGVLLQSEEIRGEFRTLNVEEQAIAGHDRLIVLFPHMTPRHYPDTLAELSRRYEVRFSQLDRDGRGFIVFDVHPDRE
jgi:uncharacterized membrane protein